MQQERIESRWASIKRWADEYEAARQEHERTLPQRRKEERIAEDYRQKLARREAMLNTAVPLLAVIAGVLALFSFSSGRYSLVQRDAMPITLLVACLWGALNVYGLQIAYVQRKFKGALHLAGWLTLSVFLMPLSFFTFRAAGIFLNGVLDQKPARIYRTTVEERRTERYKSSTYYYLRLRDWKNPNALVQIDASRDAYEQAATRKVAVVETKPGFFGFEWMMRYSFR